MIKHNKNISESEEQELFFGVDNDNSVEVEQAWYQGYSEIAFPLLIIIVGILQFVLRKWILPVSEEIISKLEDQFPSQGLMYNPGFGLFLIILGFVLLILFNMHLFL